MPDQQPRTHDPAERASQAVAHAPLEDAAHEPIDEMDPDDWLDEPEEADELPPRPRRRLLTPIPLALLAVLLIAGGFIGGVEIQKGEESSASAGGATAGAASRFAALRGGAAGTGAGKTATGGGAGGGFPGAGAGAGRPTIGTVAYLAGNTLYVTNPEGNTVKVTTSAATSVTKSVKTKVNGIHPGETVTVTGATSGGAVSAESISVGSGGGGLAGLFGGSGAKGTGGGSAGSAAPQLFGSG
jgi:hypothetical protein